MKVKQIRLKCAVNGCRNRDTFYVSRSGVYFNSPNICKECAKLIYEAMYPESENAVVEAAEETENVFDEAVEETNEGTAEDAKEMAEAEEDETILEGIPKKKTRKKE